AGECSIPKRSYLCLFLSEILTCDLTRFLPVDALRRRKAEAFFHLWVPFDSCHHFYGTLIFMYLRRPTEESVEQEEMAAVFYTTVIPMLNPMTCSLRNKDVKEAMNKVISR
uniref:Uncharacterized protein n=1 Tax=Equus caballus TaxID=9796 RepID=A0A9L0RCT6_HORSE